MAKRDFMEPAAGKLLDAAGEVFDLTAALQAMSTNIAILAGDTSAAQEIVPVAFARAVDVPGPAIPFADAETFATQIAITARRVAAVNTGLVFWGMANVEAGVFESNPLEPDDFIVIRAPAGTKLDMGKLFLHADDDTDGIIGLYWPVG